MLCGHRPPEGILEPMLQARPWQGNYDLDLRLPALNHQVLLVPVQDEWQDVVVAREP